MNYQVGKWVLYDFGDHAVLFDGSLMPFTFTPDEAIRALNSIEDADERAVLTKWIDGMTEELE